MTAYDPHENPGEGSDCGPDGVRRGTRSRRRIARSVVSTVLALALALFGGWAYLNPQPIIDQVTVWQFTPSSAIMAHVERLSLTERGKSLYYASAPLVDTKEAFSSQCPTRAEESDYGILGCYQPAAKRIFLFDVTDSRLDGTEEVTAAHEMLHAAWDRLADEQKNRITALLEAESLRLSSDQTFVDRMSFYERTEPGQRANELHSIIGTEVASLSPDLESYYAAYFTDRSVVTALHTSSNAVFVNLQNQATEILARLDSLKIGIEADYSKYSSGYTSFNSRVADFNRRANAGPFTSQGQFDRERMALVASKSALDTLFDTISARSATYAKLIAELTAIDSTSAELSRGLNIGGEVSSNL